MRAIIVSHAAIRAANRSVYRRLAARGTAVTLVVPDRWYSVLGGALLAEPEPANSPLRLIVRQRIGCAHTNLYALRPGIRDLVAGGEQASIYLDEDPPGFMALQCALAARAHGAGFVILSMQNILKRYPPPFNVIQRFVFAQANACLAASRQCEETIRKRGFTGPVAIMRFAYDLRPPGEIRRASVARRYGFGRPAIGYVGRLVHEKGVDLLLRAAQRIDSAHVVIGGDGPLRGELERLAGELGLTERVHFLGNLSPEEAIAVIGALDVCTLPSRTTGFWKEQVGRVPIEAIAQGVPIVGSNSGGIPETAGDAGLIFREDRVDDFIRCIEAALDPDRRRDLIARGLARAHDEYSLDRAADVLHTSLDASARAIA
jgi:glycosyltransferase involved in cell wall biosynthesis